MAQSANAKLSEIGDRPMLDLESCKCSALSIDVATGCDSVNVNAEGLEFIGSRANVD